jgi:hypothetical protein
MRHTPPLRPLRWSIAPIVALAALAALAAGGACGLSTNVEDAFGKTSGGTSSGPGGGGTAGSGGGSGAEDCLDGADGDGDGLVDCADPDCQQGFECAAPVPEGWEGVYAVSRFQDGQPVPSCAGGGEAETLFTGPAGPAECTACSCGPVEQATCGPPQILCWQGSTTCQGLTPVDWTQQLASGACGKPPLLGGSLGLSCRLAGPPAVLEPGACAPSAVDFPNKATWDGQVAACAATAGGGCDGGGACVPKPAGDAQSVCIRQEGSQTCPAGWTTALQAFTGGSDMRGCNACSCGDPGTSCAGGSYSFYDFDNCMMGGDPPGMIASNTCTDVSTLMDGGTWSIQASLPAANGACAAQGGEPTGGVQTDGPMTFCCH